MELATSADRQATKLSGGQQQRLALARAMVIEPPLLLLDEPLSNLDAKLRESLRYELKRLQRELGITSIYVTHDQIEALALSTHDRGDEGGQRAAARPPAGGLRVARTTSSSPSSSARRTSSRARSSAATASTVDVETEAGRVRLESAARGAGGRGRSSSRSVRRPVAHHREPLGQPGQRVAGHGHRPRVPRRRRRPRRRRSARPRCARAATRRCRSSREPRSSCGCDPSKITLVPVG